MEFIDTHQHLMYRATIGYGWTAALPSLSQGDFTLSDYQDLTVGKGIVGTIFMETGVDDSDYQSEARLVAALMTKPGSGILGQIASCRPETDADFDAWLECAPQLGIVGYRRILHEISDDVSQSQTFRNNLSKIGRCKLAFDMCFLARQLPIALSLAQACDEQTLVLDHCGVPDIAAGAFDLWADGISAIARLPHVNCKLSGIVAYCTPGTATVQTLRPWVDHVIESFGPDRMLWGSDWPVVNLGTGLPAWIDLTCDLLRHLAPDDQARIAQYTARRVYRVTREPQGTRDGRYHD